MITIPFSYNLNYLFSGVPSRRFVDIVHVKSSPKCSLSKISFWAIEVTLLNIISCIVKGDITSISYVSSISSVS